MADIQPAHGAHRGAEKYFLRMMIQEIEKGYKPGSTFRRESQMYVNRKFRSRYGHNYSDGFIKARLKILKVRYQDFSELLNQKGIYWDKKNNVVYGNEKWLSSKYMHHNIDGRYWGERNFDLMCQVFESGVRFE